MASILSIENESSDNLNETSPAPARGAEMRNFLQTRLQKNRVPPLVHAWDFYHDRQAKPSIPGTQDPNPSTPQQQQKAYTARLEHLASIPDVRAFWSVFNNFDLSALALRDSIHLFHRGVKPVWEDARNASGGRWTFRIPKAHAQQAWTELALLAIGEQLQTAIEDPARLTFRDDICGIRMNIDEFVSFGIWLGVI
ncbi:Hypothetical protein R9X50_00500900 [Acrodontium crateriforme]|uniref:Translation initiation factor eIF4e n=1 Tax=Acrodontium crateriforme TaxID=150365 RepID=A0AAQ3M6B8_9PEZI|nr:Hypothetical protein R9X50_00500900 [Acrodontium crateriforme]